MAIDATVGGAAANCYVTLAEASTYFGNRAWAEAWDDVEDPSKALITATQRIDQEEFRGTRATAEQALKWPRIELVVDEVVYETTYDGIPFDDLGIPPKVKDAVCELALLLASSDVLAPSELVQFKALSVGPISMTMNDPIPAGPLPDQVSRLLRGLRHPGVYIA